MANLPFHSFSFTLVADKQPRKAFRMKALDGGMYELHVERGSASNPISQFTREVPLDVAQQLKDALQGVGVFRWDEAYGDASAPGSLRWTLNTVFQEGVFAVASKGGSDVPPGFDGLLEELYRLDFPRPNGAGAAGPGAAAAGAPALGVAGAGASALPVMPTSIGDLAAFASKAGMPDLSGLDAAELQRRMKEEVRHMSPAEREQLITMLVQTGMGAREFWEDFFRD